MNSNFKPMLSGKCTAVHALNYPVLVSPKLDGIRALVIDGVLVSRNLKPIRNHQLQARYGRAIYNGLDGELIAGVPTAPDCFLRTTSIVSSFDAPAGDVCFYVFDHFKHSERPYHVRSGMLPNRSDWFIPVHGSIVESALELAAREEHYLEEGYEGLMIRSLTGPYKYGRSTEREGWLLKLKRFEDAEAIIVDCEELMHNANALTKDALGHAKRSSHKANKHGLNRLGAFKVHGVNGPYKDAQFSIGTGFSDAQREAYWAQASFLVGALVKYRYFPLGSKEAPRFPTFLGFRDRDDL